MEYFSSYHDDESEELSSNNATESAATDSDSNAAAATEAKATTDSPRVHPAPYNAPTTGSFSVSPSDAAALSKSRMSVTLEVEESEKALPPLMDAPNCAPQVGLFGLSGGGGLRAYQQCQQLSVGAASTASSPSNDGFLCPEDRVLFTNPKATALMAPIQGPLTPFQEKRGGWAGVYRQRLAGDCEPAHINAVAFSEQFHSFQHHGRAADPSDYALQQQINNNSTEATAAGGWSCSREAVAPDLKGYVPIGQQASRRKRLKHDDAASENFMGPWAPFLVEPAASAATTTTSTGEKSVDENESKEVVPRTAQTDGTSNSSIAPPGGGDGDEVVSKSTGENSRARSCIFHCGEELDYQGRSWLEVATAARSRGAEKAIAATTAFDSSSNWCFPCKRELHSFVGHTGGVQAIRFFPENGNLLLSASFDGTVKLWETDSKRRLRCTYTAHTQGVRDIQWSSVSGKHFYSCAYDNTVKLWDTETGQVVNSFGDGKTPYCVAVAPQQENIVIVGSASRKAVQFDARSGKIELEYAEHIGSVNTVTFCENGKKLLTTSDDKKLFGWEFGLPVVIKHISEPHMHAMPAVAKHPSERYVVYQSMDNQLVAFEAYGKFRQVSRKRFKGHIVAGYACHPAFSPDGRWLISGDSSGHIYVWDWKRGGKNVRVLSAHAQVCIDVQWHPALSSRIASAGWDGLIKLWD